jgi:hypothetical protein
VPVRFNTNQNDPRYSVPLRLNFKAKELFSPLVEELTEEVLAHWGGRILRITREKTHLAVSVLLANLIRTHQRDSALHLAISLNSTDFAQDQMNPLNVGYDAFKRVVDYLTQSQPNLVSIRRGGHFAYTSFRTRIKPETVLIQRIKRFYETLAPISLNTLSVANGSSSEGIWNTQDEHLFHEQELPIIRLKNEEGAVVSFGETPDDMV